MTVISAHTHLMSVRYTFTVSSTVGSSSPSCGPCRSPPWRTPSALPGVALSLALLVLSLRLARRGSRGHRGTGARARREGERSETVNEVLDDAEEAVVSTEDA